VPRSITKCQTKPYCYTSCRLIFLPCTCFASIYASTAAKSYILIYMWTAANFIIEGRMRPYGGRLCTVVLQHQIGNCLQVKASTIKYCGQVHPATNSADYENPGCRCHWGKKYWSKPVRFLFNLSQCVELWTKRPCEARLPPCSAIDKALSKAEESTNSNSCWPRFNAPSATRHVRQ